MALDGEVLPPGVGNTIQGTFQSEVLDKIDAEIAGLFPKAVCFTIGELQAFLTEANEKLRAHNVPFNQRGIAVSFGICSSTKTHINGRVTTMLIATDFTEDALTGEVTSMDNPTTLKQPGDLASSISDYAYDTGSMWP